MFNVGNDYLNYVCHSSHDAHHHMRNFVNAKCAKQTAILKSFKQEKSDIQCVFNVGNDYLNYVCHSSHDAHHHSRNFVKAKMCKTNSNFEKFQNAVNLIYTVCAMLQLMI